MRTLCGANIGRTGTVLNKGGLIASPSWLDENLPRPRVLSGIHLRKPHVDQLAQHAQVSSTFPSPSVFFPACLTNNSYFPRLKECSWAVRPVSTSIGMPLSEMIPIEETSTSPSYTGHGLGAVNSGVAAVGGAVSPFSCSKLYPRAYLKEQHSYHNAYGPPQCHLTLASGTLKLESMPCWTTCAMGFAS